MTTMIDKLFPIIQRYEDLESAMADPVVAADYARVQELARERASLEELVGHRQELPGTAGGNRRPGGADPRKPGAGPSPDGAR